MLPSHGRFPYSPIVNRSPFRWPDGKQLAVYVAVCIEHFSYGEGGLGLSYSPNIPHPNTYNWAWREYGNRVGGWRLLDLFNSLSIRPAALVNSECYSHCPELLAGYRNAGAEFVAHGRANSEAPNDLTDDEQRQMIKDVAATILEHEGKQPDGWMSPGANPSRHTEDYLAENGFTYTLDWPMDEQPVWMQTSAVPILSIPYPHEVNDVPMIAFHHGSSQQFAAMVTDTFDELLEQSAQLPLTYGIVVHTFIAGQPHRLRRLRVALQHITNVRDSIWLTTPGDIAAHYASQLPAPSAATDTGGGNAR